MASVLVVIFVGLMVAWWQAQGLFSALIHFVATMLAACVTLALWEPVVYGFLLNRQPESAWGLGMMAIFGLSLLAMRVVTDRAVPGNVSFANMVDRIGGGAFGLASGVVTAGILVIAVQLTGVSSFAGYRGWRVDEGGALVREHTLITNADEVAGNLLARLSSGSFSSGAPLARFHPHLAAEASLFTQAAFDDSRESINPGNIQFIEATYCIVGIAPGDLGERIDLPDGYNLVIVPTRIAVKAVEPAQGRQGAGDKDGIFRVTRAQVALTASDDPLRRGAELHFPLAYIQHGELRVFTVEGEHAWSRPGSDATSIHWVFAIPSNQDPLDIRIKGYRVQLPDAKTARTDPVLVAGLVSWRPTTISLANGEGNGDGEAGDPDGLPSNAAAQTVIISSSLPWTFDRNKMLGKADLQLQGNAVVSGRASVRAPSSRERPGKNLAVNSIHHDKTARVVQVNLGTREPQSLLGKAIGAAVNVSATPLLEDAEGDTYRAIGWAVISSGSIELAVDPQTAVMSLAQIDLGRLSETDRVVLYFHVPIGVQLTSFKLGQVQRQEIDVKVE